MSATFEETSFDTQPEVTVTSKGECVLRESVVAGRLVRIGGGSKAVDGGKLLMARPKGMGGSQYTHYP